MSQLTSAFTNYKNHLVELERVKQSQLEQRKSRDAVIVEKMSSLASQLEGDARRMILKDIEGMERIISDEDSDRGEAESNKMMTYAFTRMSDEVTSLIDARTAEIKEIATKNEELLLNILPGSIVPRMLGEEKTIAATKLPFPFRWATRTATTRSEVLLRILWNCRFHLLPPPIREFALLSD